MSEFNCNICKVSFSIELKAKRNKRCNACHAQIESKRHRLYKIINFDKIQDKGLKYYAENKDKIKEYTAKNKDVRSEKGKAKRMNALTPEEDLDINSQWDLAGYKNSSYIASYTLTPKRKRNIMRLDNKFKEVEESE